MTGFWSDNACATHGWAPHVFVHEAAHAVAAVDRNIPFERVTIYSPNARVARGADQMLGGVVVDPDPRTWVLPDQVAALEFIMAGSAAEDVIFGDIVPGGFRADQEIWRRGVGESGSLTLERLDELAGGSFAAVGTGVKAWVNDNRSRILTVAGALAGVADLNQPTMLLAEDGPWTLSADQVRALVAM